MGEFFPHISKSPKFHQINIIKITKNDCKKARERYQSLSKEKKRKTSNNTVLKDTEMSQRIKNKIWLNIEKKKKKKLQNEKKIPCQNYKKNFFI